MKRRGPSALQSALKRAEMLRHFIPEWPALWQSWQKTADELKARKK